MMNEIYRGYREIRHFTFPWPPIVYAVFMMSEAICCYLLLHKNLVVTFRMPY